MPSTLDQIVAMTRSTLERRKSAADVRALEAAAQSHLPRGFRKALLDASKGRPAIIAELKKASPSRGLIRRDFQVEKLAQQLLAGGANALSVLTEEEHFQGSLDYLRVASCVTGLPCVRKDFIVDEFQVLEARANCADALLLIVAALDDQQLRSLHGAARRFELDVLCEVHDRRELDRALALGFETIGVNSRDLRTFHVSLETAFQLVERIPSSILRIAESGIHSGEHMRALRDAGYQGFLIGESLMKEAEPGDALRKLLHDASLPFEKAAKGLVRE